MSRAILDVAREEGAPMIVMTAHGRSGMDRPLVGSVAQAVAQHAAVPVLLIKGDQGPVEWGQSAAASSSAA